MTRPRAPGAQNAPLCAACLTNSIQQVAIADLPLCLYINKWVVQNYLCAASAQADYERLCMSVHKGAHRRRPHFGMSVKHRDPPNECRSPDHHRWTPVRGP